jgi:hypothetical protein
MSEHKENQRSMVHLSKWEFIISFSLLTLLFFITWITYAFSGKELMGFYNILTAVLFWFFILAFDVKKQNKKELDENE